MEEMKSELLEKYFETMCKIESYYMELTGDDEGKNDYDMLKEDVGSIISEKYLETMSILKNNSIKLNNENIENIDYNMVVAIEYSESIYIVEKKGDTVTTYFTTLFENKECCDLQKLYSKLEIIEYSNVDKLWLRSYEQYDNGWTHYYMGQRHHMFIRREYEDEWNKKYDYTPGHYMEYTWVNTLSKIIGVNIV